MVWVGSIFSSKPMSIDQVRKDCHSTPVGASADHEFRYKFSTIRLRKSSRNGRLCQNGKKGRVPSGRLA